MLVEYRDTDNQRLLHVVSVCHWLCQCLHAETTRRFTLGDFGEGALAEPVAPDTNPLFQVPDLRESPNSSVPLAVPVPPCRSSTSIYIGCPIGDSCFGTSVGEHWLSQWHPIPSVVSGARFARVSKLECATGYASASLPEYPVDLHCLSDRRFMLWDFGGGALA